MPELLLALALSALAAPPLPAQEQTADTPYECPEGQKAVIDTKTDEWVCKPQLEIRRDVFGPDKHPLDPCPDGYWWHRTQQLCTPVVCTREPNPALIKGLCPKGYHPHLNSSADWSKPIACVVDYAPKNETTGGKNPVLGGCELCVIKKHDCAARFRNGVVEPEQCWDWRFERASDQKKKKKKDRPERPSSAVQGDEPFKAPPLRKFKRPASAACSKDAVPLEQEGGTVVCVGGPSSPACPAAAGLFESYDPADPFVCMPCLEGEESWVFDGRARCLLNPCPAGKAPVPDPGLIESYSCRKSTSAWPQEEEGLRLPSRGCLAGEGISFADGAFKCGPCGEGRKGAFIDGYQACVHERAEECPAGEIYISEKAGRNVAELLTQKRRRDERGGTPCLACPKGSVFRNDRGPLHGRCLPPDPAYKRPRKRRAPVETPAEQQENALPVIRIP